MAREPSAQAQFTAFLSRFPPGIVALVKRCLPKLRRALPGTNQIVYDYPNSLVVSFSPSDRGYEGIVTLAVHPDRVQLYFSKDLPDPNGRLEGSGSKVRSLALEAASELDSGDVHDLIRAAIRRSKVPSPGTRSTRMIIQAGSKKTPGRAGRA